MKVYKKEGLLYFGGVHQEPFISMWCAALALGSLDVHSGVRQELYLSYFLAVCVKRSFSGIRQHSCIILHKMLQII